jgi:hypothetical protein
VQNFAFSYSDFFATHEELECTLKDVCHLLAVMRMHRHQAAAFQIDLCHHLALADHDLPRHHLGDFLECNFVPTMEPDRVTVHGAREYIIRGECYNFRG